MPNTHPKIVIIGATSAIAEHCARWWVSDSPVCLVLVGRNETKLNCIAADLRLRSPQSDITTQKAHFTDPTSITQLVEGIVATGRVDTVLIAHGSLPDQALCQKNLHTVHDTLLLNGTSPVLFAEAFAGHMQQAQSGTLAIISSVAGDRGRKSNYVYGAAKGLITRYAQGLQHRLAKTGVRVVIIKPGPTNTPMTAHMNQDRMANVALVSKLIVKGIKQGKPIVYVPRKWSLVMLIIRCLPNFVFHKMDI